MDNNKEKSEHGFVKVSSNKSSGVSVNKTKKEKNSTFKVVLTSLVSGIVGASLVLGLCFYVPAVRNIFVSSDSDDTSNEVSKIFTSEGSVNKGVSIEDYSNTAISVANKVLPSVVGIEVDFSVSANYPTFSAATQSATSKATGSGVIISKDGYILTNNHIIDTSSTTTSKYYTVSDANKVLVYLYEEDNPVEAKIVGSDSVTDLAILKIDRNDLTPA